MSYQEDPCTLPPDSKWTLSQFIFVVRKNNLIRALQEFEQVTRDDPRNEPYIGKLMHADIQDLESLKSDLIEILTNVHRILKKERRRRMP